MRSETTKLLKIRAKAADAPTPVVAADAATHKPLPNAGDATLFDALPDWLRYAVDVTQRGALFMQALIERGDALLEDEHAGLPLRLKFPFELVLDARDFPEPAGYSLLRILPDGDACFERCEGANSRPVIVFDPRAGHAPGIGGF